MKIFLKTLMRLLTILLATTPGCTLAIDAQRPGEQLHVQVSPQQTPALTRAN